MLIIVIPNNTQLGYSAERIMQPTPTLTTGTNSVISIQIWARKPELRNGNAIYDKSIT